MAGISSRAANITPNKENTFQNQRFDDDLGINWVQFKWRNHDPQIGRFIEIDPLAEEYVYNSTYAFSENKVTGHVELEGLESFDVNMEVRRGMPENLTAAQKNSLMSKQYNAGSAAAGKIGMGVIKVAAIAILMVLQPEIGIPLAVADVTGVPVTPSPQAMASTTTSTVLATAENSADETVTLFRGVNSKNVHFDDAIQGVSKPNGGTASAAEHHSGSTINSPFTSWTTDPEVALNFAIRGSGQGVVLKAKIPIVNTTKSPNIKQVQLAQKPSQVVSESEVLVTKPVNNAKVEFFNLNDILKL